MNPSTVFFCQLCHSRDCHGGLCSSILHSDSDALLFAQPDVQPYSIVRKILYVIEKFAYGLVPAGEDLESTSRG